MKKIKSPLEQFEERTVFETGKLNVQPAHIQIKKEKKSWEELVAIMDNTPKQFIKFPQVATDYVPYQKCPICDGTGEIQVSCDPTMTAAHFHNPCTVCHGAKIIPMHKL